MRVTTLISTPGGSRVLRHPCQHDPDTRGQGKAGPLGDRAGLGAASCRRVVRVLARAWHERRTGTGVVDEESMARYVVAAASVSKPDCSAYERRIFALRFAGSWGPLGRHPPACGAFDCGKGPDQAHQRRCWLACLDQCTACPSARGTQHYEQNSPGDVVRVDVTKLGRIRDGSVRPALGHAKGNRISPRRSRLRIPSLRLRWQLTARLLRNPQA